MNVGNRDQLPPKKPWEYLGITEQEYQEKIQRANEGLNKIFEEATAPYIAAMKKYKPLVENLSDIDFVGLFRVVMDERQVRHIKLLLSNPAYALAARHQAEQQVRDGEN